MDKKKREKLEEMSEYIRKDIFVLQESLYFFDEFSKNILKFNFTNEFLENYKFNFYGSMIIGICRQLNNSENGYSLNNLLRNILKFYDSFSKKDYVNKYYLSGIKNRVFSDKKSGINIKNGIDFVKKSEKQRGEDKFESFFGKGDFIDCRIICKDIQDFQEKTKKIKAVRDKYFAHKDKDYDKYTYDASIQEIKDIVLFMENIFIKYYDLLLGSDDPIFGNLKPNILNK